MNQEDLLDIIDWDEAVGAYNSMAEALRAVVELHKPWETLPQLENPLVWCEVCQENYPCPTIQAIEKALV